MMEIITFKADHMKALLDRSNAKFLTTSHADIFEQRNDFSFTGVIDGKVLICGGIFKYWEGRGEAWAIIDKNSREHFIKFHNAAKRLFSLSPLRRIEATVDNNYKEGLRWMALLGFKFEGVLEKYNPDGTDVSLFAKVRGV